AILVEPLRHTTSGPVLCSRNERLNLNQQRPCAFHAGSDNRTGHVVWPFLQKHFRRICHWHQSRRRHLKNADFVGRAKTVLSSADYAMVVMAFTFEIQDGVDYMFQGPWPCDRTIFGYVSDKKHGQRAVLRQQ